MATTPENDAFFREVDEGLRRDQVEGLFRRYGMLILVVVLLGLGGFGCYLWWQHDQQSRASEDGIKLTSALADVGAGRRDQGKAQLDKLTSSPRAGYSAAARLALADMALDRGDTVAAVAGFRAIAGDDKIAAPFRDLALIRQTTTEFDALPPATVVARLRPLAQSGNPWFGSAGEIVAIAYLKMGKPELAGPLFAAIAKDDKSPTTIRSRALQLAGVLGVDAIPQRQATPAAAGRE